MYKRVLEPLDEAKPTENVLPSVRALQEKRADEN